MTNKNRNCETSLIRVASKKLEGRWCKHNVATDNEERSVPYDSPKAVSFCAIGILAITKSQNDFSESAYQKATRRVLAWIENNTSFSTIPSFNDDSETREKDVINAFEKSIIEIEEKNKKFVSIES